MAKKQNFFWASYADLMTSLFFIMLVLFVLVIAMMKKQQNNLLVENERLNKILKLEEQFKPLQDDDDFYYLEDCQKFVAKNLMGQEIFNSNSYIIKPEYISSTLTVGKKIESFLESVSSQNSNFSYLLIIEGNMANRWDMSYNQDSQWGYDTSYKRALAVYDLWNKNNINFRKYNVEVLLCGSGFNGLCRDKVEENNKRFSIQIIPKVSNR